MTSYRLVLDIMESARQGKRRDSLLLTFPPGTWGCGLGAWCRRVWSQGDTWTQWWSSYHLVPNAAEWTSSFRLSAERRWSCARALADASTQRSCASAEARSSCSRSLAYSSWRAPCGFSQPFACAHEASCASLPKYPFVFHQRAIIDALRSPCVRGIASRTFSCVRVHACGASLAQE